MGLGGRTTDERAGKAAFYDGGSAHSTSGGEGGALEKHCLLNWLWEGWTDFWVVRSCCRVEAVRDVWGYVPEAPVEIECT